MNVFDPYNETSRFRVDDDVDDVACCVCGCTECEPCPGGCAWADDPLELMRDICSVCAEAIKRFVNTNPNTFGCERWSRLAIAYGLFPEDWLREQGLAPVRPTLEERTA